VRTEPSNARSARKRRQQHCGHKWKVRCIGKQMRTLTTTPFVRRTFLRNLFARARFALALVASRLVTPCTPGSCADFFALLVAFFRACACSPAAPDISRLPSCVVCAHAAGADYSAYVHSIWSADWPSVHPVWSGCLQTSRHTSTLSEVPAIARFKQDWRCLMRTQTAATVGKAHSPGHEHVLLVGSQACSSSTYLVIRSLPTGQLLQHSCLGSLATLQSSVYSSTEHCVQ
jgi:hypothetical protein